MSSYLIIRQIVEISNREERARRVKKPTLPPPDVGTEGSRALAGEKRRVTEQEGPYSVERLREIENELRVVIQERVFQMIEDRVGKGAIKDLAVLELVTDAVGDAVKVISPKVEDVLKGLRGTER